MLMNDPPNPLSLYRLILVILNPPLKELGLKPSRNLSLMEVLVVYTAYIGGILNGVVLTLAPVLFDVDHSLDP